MTLNAAIDMTGSPSFMALGTKELRLGTAGNADIVFIRNGTEVARVGSGGIVADISQFTDVVTYTPTDMSILSSSGTAKRFIFSGGASAATSSGAFGIFGGNTNGDNPGSIRLVGGNVSTGGVDLETSHTSANIRLLVNSLVRWTVSSDGRLTQDSTNGGAIVFGVTGSGLIQGTSDGIDDRQLVVCGGGAASSTRGGYALFNGNEVGGTGGNTFIVGGNVATGFIDLICSHATPGIRFYTVDLLRWSVNPDGNLAQNATNGGDFIITKASTSVRQAFVTGITAAGTISSNATALTGVTNIVTTASAGTGVRCWGAGDGSILHVVNRGANALLVYPDTGGTINGAGTDAGVSVAVGAGVILYKVASLTWFAVEAPAA